MAKKAELARRPDEVLEPVSEDLALIRRDGTSITQLLVGVVAWFNQTKALERRSAETLAQAHGLKAPTDAHSDEVTQLFVKRAARELKEVEEHHGICSALSQLHRRFVSIRKRGTDPLEAAKTLATDLHNTYVTAERRRAEAETNRQRLVDEQRAREARDRELRDLELAALKAEEGSPDLSAREQVFVDRYFETGNGVRAAMAAGYKDAPARAAALLIAPKITRALDAKRQAADLRTQATAVRSAPVEVETRTVAPRLGSAAHDVTTWGGECTDEVRFIEAIFAGTHGIPRDVLMVNPVKLNEYGKSLHERLDLWPGCRHTKKTGVR